MDETQLTDDEKRRKKYDIGHIFSPTIPINEKDLFAGRQVELKRVIDTVNQRGQHCIVFGERGVGKTSFSNVLADFFQGLGKIVRAPRTSCHSADDFSVLWRRIFKELRAKTPGQGMGLIPDEDADNAPTLADLYANEVITPDVVRQALGHVSDMQILILIVDEFDRLSDKLDRQLFADTIKTLSDYAVKVTLLLVGVAEAVDGLISGHESIQRNLVEIRMTRMNSHEIRQIVTDRLPRVGMSIEDEALSKICAVSRGLPHYAHLVGQHAAWLAVEYGTLHVTEFHVGCAMTNAIKESDQTIAREYHKATMSPRKDNLFSRVLLAAALAPCDQFGYFAAVDVRSPMSSIMKETYGISHFTRHLTAFCDESRASVLQEIGERYQRRFRFRNPLMQSHVIIRGIADGLITLEQLNEAPECFGAA